MANQNNNSFKKCSKCNIGYDQDLGSSCSIEVGKQRRIFNKDGKRFCFNCLASEYKVNCQYCHKRINSKDEFAYWGGGVISINGDYDYCKADDWVFTCWGCEKKISEKRESGVKPSWHSGWGPILFPEQHIRKCRIAGCSQKPYYECVDLCLPHSRPCKGGKIKPNGKICSAAMGSDEGDICEFCKNQTETYQQQKGGLDNESNREFEKFEKAHEKAQNYWNSLSSSERERECERLVQNMKLGKYWGIQGKEGQGSGWACDGSFWIIENGKFVSTSPHLVPVEIAEEFMKKEFGENALVLRDYKVTKKDKDNSPSPVPAPQSITNSNDKSDNSVNPVNSPQPNQGKDNLSEVIKSDVKTIKFENKENNSEKPKSAKNPTEDTQTLIINLRSIKKITLTSDGNLIIEFNDRSQKNQTITAEQINKSQELQSIKSYCQKNGKTSLNQQELSRIIDTNATAKEKPKNGNSTLLIGGIGATFLIIGVGIGVLLKRKKVKRN